MDSSGSFAGGEVPGNLALCQHTGDDNPGIECLDIEPSGEISMQERVDKGGMGILNWRFENGLLRAVNMDGYTTNQCLGPSVNVTTLDAATKKPYELVLQDCPESIQRDTGNIFSHDASSNNSITPRMEDKEWADQALHMRFLIVGDGRITSLAPVNGKAAEAFCVTAMKWDDVLYTNATLAPCLDGNATLELGGTIEQKQQLFELDAGSSFEPFLLHLPREDKSGVQFAYQIGYTGPLASATPERYDSYAIKVVTESDLSLLSETIVSEGVNATSGLVTLPDFDNSGKMEAHLIGISRGGLESSWLTSTSFEVPGNEDIVINEAPGGKKKMSNGMTWALVCFLSFMTFYVCLVKANSIFCPSKPMQKRKMIRKKMKMKRRNSDTQRTERTVANSVTEAASRAREEDMTDNDWGRTSGRSGRSSFRSSIDSQHSILFRISEEQFDMLDIEQASSDGAPTFAAEIRSTDTNSESEDDMDSTAGVTDEEKEIASVE